MEGVVSSGPLEGQRGLFAPRDCCAGEIVLTEAPLLVAQHAFNRKCGYAACAHCLRSLETPRATARRLVGDAAAFADALPDAAAPRCACAACGDEYCGEACRAAAAASYHGALCCKTRDARGRAAHAVARVDALWLRAFPPPDESLNVTLVLRLLTTGGSAALPWLYAEAADAAGRRLAVLDARREALEGAWEIARGLFPASSYDDFERAVSAVATNALGCGTSAVDVYAAGVSPAGAERRRLDATLRAIEAAAGPRTHAEGCGIYQLHCAMNHACDANCANRFVENSSTLQIVARRPLVRGEELFASYLDDETAPRSERRRNLLENYNFDCACARCETEQSSEAPAVAEPAAPHVSAAVDAALALLAAIQSGDERAATQGISAALAKPALKALGETDAVEATLRRRGCGAWDHGGDAPDDAAKRLGAVAAEALEAAAARGALAVTRALLGKAHSKAFGSKAARRAAAAAAFVAACSAEQGGETVRWYLEAPGGAWLAALDLEHRPRNCTLADDDVCAGADGDGSDGGGGAASLPAAWEQGAAALLLRGCDAAPILARFEAAQSRATVAYLRPDAGYAGPDNYHDADRDRGKVRLERATLHLPSGPPGAAPVAPSTGDAKRPRLGDGPAEQGQDASSREEK